jgi:hypothetical protein
MCVGVWFVCVCVCVCVCVREAFVCVALNCKLHSHAVLKSPIYPVVNLKPVYSHSTN